MYVYCWHKVHRHGTYWLQSTMWTSRGETKGETESFLKREEIFRVWIRRRFAMTTKKWRPKISMLAPNLWPRDGGQDENALNYFFVWIERIEQLSLKQGMYKCVGGTFKLLSRPYNKMGIIWWCSEHGPDPTNNRRRYMYINVLANYFI